MTTRMNPYLTSGIYLTSVKVSQCIIVDKNRREKEEAKIKKQKIQLSKRLVFNKSGLNIFKNTNTGSITHCRIHLKKPCKLPSLPSQLPPSRTPLSALEIIWATSQITEVQQ